MHKPVLFCVSVLLVTVSLLAYADAKTVHTEKSLYRNISVVKEGDLTCLVFETRKENPPYQTCKDENDPKRFVFSYTKLILTGLLYNANPEKILVIGLGGGTLPMALSEMLPNAEITSVEIDPAVIKLAKQYFEYQESPRIKTVERDGRLFIKRAALKKESFDWIILDAFNGDYIPEHLMTQEFLQEVKSVLSETGIITANTFSQSKLYAYESATYHSVYGDFYNVKRKNTGNRIVLAPAQQPLIKLSKLELNATRWESTFEQYGVDVDWLLDHIQTKKDWDQTSDLLTDQYAPANLLKFDKE
ncbi:spermidine synthase [Pleionea sediminis]|uniref:spermidine synthase n=1 Tax=Pleionea sediminis TaxID=2569479 RepID=UPI0011846E37|nr:fused MFS/spermidine synthase [Pleionea sediminis]